LGGGAIGGIAGLIAALTTGVEDKKKKEERIKSLMEQYQSNIPKN